jgi:hypothetical protein
VKLQPLEAAGKPYGWAHWCPGCEELHRLPYVEPPAPGWTFDGNMEAPTFAPSFAHTMGPPDRRRSCHYILTAGVLDFQPDCSHALRGKVPLPDIPDGVRWPGSS